MANAYISEYAVSAQQNGGIIPAMPEPSLAVQVVAVGAEAKSSAFNAKTRFVRLHTDLKCHFKFGLDPTATTSNARMATDATEFFAVDAGDKVSIIAAV